MKHLSLVIFSIWLVHGFTEIFSHFRAPIRVAPLSGIRNPSILKAGQLQGLADSLSLVLGNRLKWRTNNRCAYTT